MAKLDIARHLAAWGLRGFSDEDSYYAWQRQSLSGEQLRLLQQAVETRREGGDADQEFYDLAASPDVLPVLYSQRYGYYHVLGPAIADVLEGGQQVLDVGCGIGILTTWYATCFPDVTFLGIDRSLKSIEVARQFAQSVHLENVSFRHCEMPQHEIPVTFDTIVSTQALFQSESDPGLPSRSGRALNAIGIHGNNVVWKNGRASVLVWTGCCKCWLPRAGSCSLKRPFTWEDACCSSGPWNREGVFP